MAEARRRFDEDFKQGAVRLVHETGKPISRVARELGINEGTLGNWCAKDRRARGEDSGALSEDERAAGGGVRDAVLDPLGCDETGHGYRLIASSTQRAALRLSTSHRIRSSAFSLRSRLSSSRSLSLNAPSPRRRRS